jgi:hypothetical protein
MAKRPNMQALRALAPPGPFHVDDWGNLCGPDDRDGDAFVMVKGANAVGPYTYTALKASQQRHLLEYLAALANADRDGPKQGEAS